MCCAYWSIEKRAPVYTWVMRRARAITRRSKREVRGGLTQTKKYIKNGGASAGAVAPFFRLSFHYMWLFPAIICLRYKIIYINIIQIIPSNVTAHSQTHDDNSRYARHDSFAWLLFSLPPASSHLLSTTQKTPCFLSLCAILRMQTTIYTALSLHQNVDGGKWVTSLTLHYFLAIRHEQRVCVLLLFFEISDMSMHTGKSRKMCSFLSGSFGRKWSEWTFLMYHLRVSRGQITNSIDTNHHTFNTFALQVNIRTLIVYALCIRGNATDNMYKDRPWWPRSSTIRAIPLSSTRWRRMQQMCRDKQNYTKSSATQRAATYRNVCAQITALGKAISKCHA